MRILREILEAVLPEFLPDWVDPLLIFLIGGSFLVFALGYPYLPFFSKSEKKDLFDRTGEVLGRSMLGMLGLLLLLGLAGPTGAGTWGEYLGIGVGCGFVIAVLAMIGMPLFEEGGIKAAAGVVVLFYLPLIAILTANDYLTFGLFLLLAIVPLIGLFGLAVWKGVIRLGS